MPHKETTPSAAKLLAPQHMIDGYLALTAKAKEQLGPQAWIECDKNLYWVHVFPEVDRVFLGLVYAQADCTLDAVVIAWHREWRAMTDAQCLEERYLTDHEWEYLAWYEQWRESMESIAKEKPKAGSLPPAFGATTAHPLQG